MGNCCCRRRRLATDRVDDEWDAPRPTSGTRAAETAEAAEQEYYQYSLT